MESHAEINLNVNTTIEAELHVDKSGGPHLLDSMAA